MLSDQISNNKKNFLINLIKMKYCYSVHNASNKFNFVKSNMDKKHPTVYFYKLIFINS